MYIENSSAGADPRALTGMNVKVLKKIGPSTDTIKTAVIYLQLAPDHNRSQWRIAEGAARGTCPPSKFFLTKTIPNNRLVPPLNLVSPF